MMQGRRTAFRDRREAGRQLAQELRHLAAERPLVLALPRGGVPVAVEVARALGADLDLLFVRKLGAPGHEELGIGAVVDGAHPQLVLNDAIIEELGVDADYLRAELQHQLAEIERRRQRYVGDTPPAEIAGRTVIIVDDGIATGGTIKAALKGMRRAGAGRIVLAVPVAPPDIVAALRRECDELVCPLQPEPFHAVGAHYSDFEQTSDAEVVRLLQAAGRA